MRFGAPQFFPLFIIVPLTILFYFWAFQKKRILIEKYLSPELKPRLLTSLSYTKQRLQTTLLIACLLFAIGAVIQPKWGFHWEKVAHRGIDIIIALDVSKSMLAEDIAPNRITRAKRKIGDLLQIIKGDRVGLIAFAGVAHLQVPLTTDYGVVAIFLDAIDTELIPVQGTAIGETITTAIRAFEASPLAGTKNGRVLILMTDGEDLAGDAMKAAVAAKAAGVQIYTIGIGKAEGAPMPVAGGGFKKDQKGELVLTRLDESMLKEIALTTGGGYVQSIAGNEDLNQVYKTIQMKAGEGATPKGILKTDRKQIFVERYQWPLLVALFCLVLERFLSNRIGLLLMTLLFVQPVWAGSTERGEAAYKKGEFRTALKEFQDAQVDAPQRSDRSYNTANGYYKIKQYEEANQLFSSVSKSDNRALKENGFYNGGNTAYRQGKLDNAVDAYKKALEIDPKDEDAKYNLNFVQQEIARRLAKKKKSPSSSDGDKKGSKGKQEKGDEAGEKKGKSSASAGNKKDQGEEKRNKKFDNQDKQMTKEEAEQWLSLVKEDRSMSNTNEKAKGQPGSRPPTYPVGKDW